MTELDVSILNSVTYPVIDASPGLREVYIKENGEFVNVGDVIHRPKLAATLRRIADNPESFYTGSLAEDIVREITTDGGGIITLGDLANYTSIWRDPVHFQFKNLSFTVTPPPFGGSVFALAMNILDNFDLIQDDVDSTHFIVESWKWAFDDRFALGDPAFLPNITEIVNTMTSKSHADLLAAKISANTTFPADYYCDLVNTTEIDQVIEDHGTMNLNVLDKFGNAVAVTSTVNLYFGSLFVGPTTGIVYNNQMDDFAVPQLINSFDVPPAPNNYIQPGKRPLSSMNPMIATNQDNQVVYVGGGSGGTRIITAPMLVALNILLFNNAPDYAIGKSRMHHQLLPNKITIELEFPQHLLDGLTEKNHIVTTFFHI